MAVFKNILHSSFSLSFPNLLNKGFNEITQKGSLKDGKLPPAPPLFLQNVWIMEGCLNVFISVWNE